ncbi:MAG: YgiW/YdeI family stress tolerance OB fold protein [Mailhella sp.]|nr:YgiW/YdeI family stress tolerance OB fold protein [Mailhella sp.]MBR6467944.1 YgiW/YdeI family stress tolerance OB fold protein [Desulfovibrio sp.]
MRILTALALVLLLASPAFADFQGGAPAPAQGGFQGPGASGAASTVAEAKKARDDSWAVLTGHIVSRAGGDHEHYIFRDKSGEIIVDIDDKYFSGRTVTPQNLVRISGEVDKGFAERTKIDVKQLEILQ